MQSFTTGFIPAEPCCQNRLPKTIHELGYDTGSGFMVGLPGQTLKNIAEDLLLLKAIPCQMAGIGPFISNPRTELAGEKNGEPELTRRADGYGQTAAADG